MLKNEANYYGLDNLRDALINSSIGSLKSFPYNNLTTGYITVGYRGSFASGRDGLADVKFRKLARILIAGKVQLCREVFGETLNESRDPDHTWFHERYTSRFYLKHNVLEQCFDALMENGFRCVASCGSGTSNVSETVKPGADLEENRWNHYNEFIFCRP